MNLGKLLGAGRSFFGGGGVVSYREDKRVYLPKFNTVKNPFEPKATGDQPRTAVSTPPAAPVVARPAAQAVKAPVFAPAQPPRGGGWAGRLNPFRGPEPVVPALVNPVQTELSLQAVKVLHNDLTDADVEVVPVKSRTVATVSAPRLLPTRESIEMFGERRLETA